MCAPRRTTLTKNKEAEEKFMEAVGRLIRRLVGIAALLTLAACQTGTTPSANSSPGTAKQYTVVMVGFTQQQAFWHSVQNGAEQAGKDFGVTVKYSAPNVGSDAAMISLLEPAIATKPDGIAIEFAGKDMEAITKTALNAGIKVVLYNNNRFEKSASSAATTDPAITTLAYVGQDESHSGEVIATAFLQYLPSGGGRVLLVNPNPPSLVIALRLQAAKSVLVAHGYSPDVLLATADATQNLALTGAYLQAHPDTKGILSLNVNGIAPAAQYVDQNKLNVAVCGFDINDVVFALMKTGGSLKCILDQQPYLQGYLAIENLALALKSGFAPVNINTGSLVIDKANVDQVQKLITAGLD